MRLKVRKPHLTSYIQEHKYLMEGRGKKNKSAREDKRGILSDFKANRAIHIVRKQPTVRW